MRSRLFHGASAVAVALTFGAWGAAALAQPTPVSTANADSTDVREVEVVAATGSYIQRETTSLPVDVVSNQDLEAQGSPTTLDLVKTITASASGLGESNRYNGGAGTSSINLRGFGASRTLSLMNGRRLPDTTAAAFQGGGANLNAIPSAAIGRIEILKDGAAATYGSEAIGGVVNFITRTDLDGFEFQGQYRYIDGSDGDYEASLAWGQRWDRGNVLLTAGYRHRSRLDIHERDWGIMPYYAAAAGGFSGNSNPGNYNQNLNNPAAASYAFRDNGCTELGGTLVRTQTVANTTAGGTSAIGIPVNPLNPETSTVATTCNFQFSNFNDLVNEENHYQFYGEVNYDLSDSIRLHAEASYAIDDVPDQRLSPSNGNTQFPTPILANCMTAYLPSPPNPANTCPTGQAAPGGGTSGSLARAGAQNYFVPYNVPFNNPGLRRLAADCAASPTGVGVITPAQCALVATAAAAGGPGLDLSQTAFRFIANAGSPRGTDGADHQTIHIETYRVSTGLSGDFNDSLHWDTNVLWAQSEGVVETADLLVDRVQLALNGFGSRLGATDQCTPAERTLANAGNAAVGCYFFNPMSNAIPTSAVNGNANPFYRGGTDASVINNPDLLLWLYGPYTNTTTNRLFVADAVISGDTPLSLSGGQVQFALGTQYRWNRDIFDTEGFFDNVTYPCVDSVDDGTPACGAPNGPLIFFGSGSDSDTTRSVWALFGETRLPVTETLEVTLAARYEHFSNGIGDTTNPKVSVRWQLNDAIAFRASAGTTFRAPSTAQVSPNCATGVANLAGQYRAVRTCGNPLLTPETAVALNFGMIVQHSGLNVTLDYWNIRFKGELTTEGASNLVAAMFPATGGDQCGLTALRARFQFAGDICTSANILRVDTFTVNGPTTDASGLDFRGSYDWGWDSSWYEGRYQVGAEATYLFEYSRGAFSLFGAPSIVFAAPFNRAGTYDLLSAFFSYPKLKANLWLNYNRGPFNVRWQAQYTQGVEPAINTVNTIAVPDATQPFGYHAERLGRTDDYWQHNLIVRFEFNDRWSATLNVQNIFDEDPPFAVSNFNYDYTNGNPLGRTFEIGIKGRF